MTLGKLILILGGAGCFSGAMTGSGREMRDER